jgi:hypothetical protein
METVKCTPKITVAHVVCHMQNLNLCKIGLMSETNMFETKKQLIIHHETHLSPDLDVLNVSGIGP